MPSMLAAPPTPSPRRSPLKVGLNTSGDSDGCPCPLWLAAAACASDTASERRGGEHAIGSCPPTTATNPSTRTTNTPTPLFFVMSPAHNLPKRMQSAGSHKPNPLCSTRQQPSSSVPHTSSMFNMRSLARDTSAALGGARATGDRPLPPPPPAPAPPTRAAAGLPTLFTKAAHRVTTSWNSTTQLPPFKLHTRSTATGCMRHDEFTLST